jgi:hypothetical protein
MLKKFSLTMLIMAFSSPIVYAMVMLEDIEEITNTSISFNKLDYPVVIKGHCVLDHNIDIIPPHGRLILAPEAQLDIRSKVPYAWTSESPSEISRGIGTQQALKISFMHKNSVDFCSDSKINIHGSVAFYFAGGISADFKGTIVLKPQSLFRSIIAQHWKDRFYSLFCLSDGDISVERAVGSKESRRIAKLITQEENSTYITVDKSAIFGFHQGKSAEDSYIVGTGLDFLNDLP